jgi:hypothetical protein
VASRERRTTQYQACPAPVGSALLALLVLVACGCGQRTAATDRSPVLSNRTKGFAYVAILAAEHPLYGELARLERATSRPSGVALRNPIAQPPASERTLIGGVIAQSYPTPALTEQRKAWEENTGMQLPTDLSTLAPDLQSRLAWERRQIRDRTVTALRSAEADQSRRLAKAREQAIRQRQERLNNLGLDLSITEAESGAQAQAERERILAEVEQVVASERAAADQETAKLRARLRAEEQAGIIEAERRMLRRMAQRVEAPITSTEPFREAMREWLGAIDKPAWVRDQAVSIPSQEGPRLVSEAAQAWSATAGRMDEAGRQQTERLRARRAVLAREIAQDTRAAALRVARERHIDVTFPPLEPAAGRDVTPELRRALHQLWHTQLEPQKEPR